MHEIRSIPTGVVPDELLELTAAQQGVWYGQLVDPGSPKYNIGECFQIHGDLDEELFAAALARALALCDSLNLEFVVRGETVRQRVVHRPAADTGRIRAVDLSATDDPVAAAERYMADDMSTVDRLDAPRHHFALLRLGARLHYWYVRFHHIAVDGLGGAVFGRAVAELYGRAAGGEDLAEAELPAAAPCATSSPTRRRTSARTVTRPTVPTGPAGSPTWRTPPRPTPRVRMPQARRTRAAVPPSYAAAPTPPRPPDPRSGCTPARPCPWPCSTRCAVSR